MVSGNVGGQVWFALASTQGVPYSLAATAAFGIALVGGLGALSRRVHMARRRARLDQQSLSTGKEPRWRAEPRVSLSDMASVHLTVSGSGAQIRQVNSGENAQAPSSIGLSPCSPDPLLATSGIGEEISSPDPTASANGSAGSELPHEATSDGPG